MNSRDDKPVSANSEGRFLGSFSKERQAFFLIRGVKQNSYSSLMVSLLLGLLLSPVLKF